MARLSGPFALLVSSLVVLGAARARAQVKPLPKVPVTKGPGGRPPALPASGPAAGPAAGALPAGFIVVPDRVVIGEPLTFTVTTGLGQAAPAMFKILSDVGTVQDISVPSGRNTASISYALPPGVPWQFINYCVTPDLSETRYPCAHPAAKKAVVGPFDPATVGINRFRINGDDGTGTAVVPRGKAMVLEVNLNAAPPAASITMGSDILTSFHRIIIASSSPVASTAVFVDLQLALGGKKGTGRMTAELNGKAVARNIEIPPLAQVDRTCFFDDRPTAGRYSSSFDYCTNEITSAKVTGGQTASGFIRRGFASREPVYVELSSSDPDVATVSPASASISATQRGMAFSVKTVPVGGTPRTVTITVIEGGTYQYLLTLTVQ